MKKLIEIEFKDDFVPPAMFSQASGSKCEDCPFRIALDDDYPYCLLREWHEIYHRTFIMDGMCPIRKYFEVTDKES